MVEWWQVTVAGFILLLLGVLLVFAGTLLSAIKGGAKVEGGGVLVVGPVPVIFGSSTKMAIIAGLLGLALMLVSLVIYYILARAWAG